MNGIRRRTLPEGVATGDIASPNGSTVRCTGLSPDGWLYLTSFGNGPVLAWDPDGEYRGPFGGGGLDSPFGVAVDSLGEVIVASQNNARYYVFGSADAHGFLRSVAADGLDHRWIACYGHNTVVPFNPEGAEVPRLESNLPAGLAITYEFSVAEP